MCGIAGVVAADAGARRAIWGQLETLRHRGPDSEGVFEDGPAVIGQTRLRIIDLVTGDPPITNEDGAVGVALNGEIYNYRWLREELLAAGHQLKTEGDTEVIAHLAEDLAAADLARRLEGMFAFACWDRRRQRLVLGRDRVGKKPLYYWAGGGILVFGSEIKAVLAHPAVPRRLAPEALPAYLTFGYVPTPHTFFEGVRSLPPGHVLTFEPGLDPQVEPYWSPPLGRRRELGSVAVSLQEAAGQARALLRAAVERRLVADVPLGAFLSGGIDSSAVVALMAELSPRPVATFCIGFEDDTGFDERPYAELVATRLGTDHTEFVVRPDAAQLVERLVWHHDQPFGDSSALPTYLLCELTRGHVTVALSGDGGDEVFGGYERFAAALARRWWERAPGRLRSGVAGAAARLPAGALAGRLGSLKRLVANPHLSLPRSYLAWVSYVPDRWRDRLVDGASGWAYEDYQRIWGSGQGASLLDRLLDLNLRTYLLDDLLPKVDRMSMAHALEVRSPFLDRELIEFAARLPGRLHVRGFSLKRVLRAAVADLLPAAIIGRRKRGFGVPLDRWFRTELASYVEGRLCSSETRLREHVDATALEEIVARHRAGAEDNGHALWTLLTLEVFLRAQGW
jgi:asparagine synthase (glutamine-hydrolysing)